MASCEELEDFIGSPEDENTEQPEPPGNTDVELPLYCDVNTIEGWTNTRFCKNGMTIFTRNFEETSDVQKTLMFVPVDSLGMVSVYGEFDENGYPKYLAFDDVVAFMDDYTDTTFSATLIKGEQVLWTATDMTFERNVGTKSWSENNWARNAAALSGLITSGIGVGVGVALTSSGVGAVAGIASIGLASKALVDNLNVLFGPGESYAEDEYIKNQLMGIGQNTLVDVLAEDSDSYLTRIFKNSDYFSQSYDLPNLFWAELAIGLVDKIWGKTVTESQRQMAYALAQRSYQVVTEHASEVNKHTVVLYGYITPDAITPLNQFADVEYGIVVYKKENPSERKSKEDIGGNGGEFSLYFNGLDVGTEYCYFTYYYDMTNSCFRQGATKSFTTLSDDYLTLNSISYDNDYFYYTAENEVGYVLYNLTAKISGNTYELEEFQFCGIYLWDSDKDERIIFDDGLEGSYNNSEIKIPISLPIDNFNNVNYSTYYAEASQYYFGVYVQFSDGSYYMSSPVHCKFVYDKKPIFRYISVGPVSVSETMHVEDTETGETWSWYSANHVYSYFFEGVFWIDSIQWWSDQGYFAGENSSEPSTLTADMVNTMQTNIVFGYPSYLKKWHSLWAIITTKSGEKLSSNSLVYGGSPTSPTVSIGGTQSITRTKANKSGVQLIKGRQSESIGLIILEDTHETENHVIEIDKLQILNR